MPTATMAFKGLGPAPSEAIPAIELTRILEQVKRGSIRYFLEQRTPNGLVYDRAPLRGKGGGMASMAATGFGLAAWVLAAENRLITKKQAKQWALQALTTAEKVSLPEYKGWLPHFVDGQTGRIWPGTEVSSIDTILFILGAIAAGEYFGGEVREKAYALFERIDFPAMLTDDGIQPRSKSFSLGFTLDEKGKRRYIQHRWDAYSEGILVPLLALGSSRFSVPDDVWSKGWRREKTWRHGEKKTFVNLPLFTYFYPHAFLDLKNKKDICGENYWEASRTAVALQIQYCQTHGYPDGLFGITACDGPSGYQINSAQTVAGNRFDDGTIAPAAILSCLPFAADETLGALPYLKQQRLLEGPYGASCGYNVYSGWRASDALGIDLGSMLLMMDAHDNKLIHRMIAKSPVIQKAMARAGFKPA